MNFDGEPPKHDKHLSNLPREKCMSNMRLLMYVRHNTCSLICFVQGMHHDFEAQFQPSLSIPIQTRTELQNLQGE